MKTAFTAETQSRRERRLRSLFSVSLRLCGGLFAFVSCTTPPPAEIEEKPDESRPREAQSDFLDIGKQAGIEWLSFVPNDQREYPELFEGLDRDQKRHLRLAPLETPDERVLIEFNLPQGSKLWPVDWYGKELMAIQRPTDESIPGSQVSVALGIDADVNIERDATGIGKSLAEARAAVLKTKHGKAVQTSTLQGWRDGVSGDPMGDVGLPSDAFIGPINDFDVWYSYCVREVPMRRGTWLVVLEYVVMPTKGETKTLPVRSGAEVLRDISIRRDLALEGFPKHKCSSSVEDLQAGRLVFPGGTLSLPLKAGQVARKTGGDSTIQVDGEGAKPWLILRRLKESGAEGDIRTRVRLDTIFARRVERPSGRFSAGRRLQNGAVVWDYADSDAEQQLVGIIATGKELLALEVVSQGLRDGQARRAAREAAQQLIGSAQIEAAGEPLKVLEGWNVGTMGREK